MPGGASDGVDCKAESYKLHENKVGQHFYSLNFCLLPTLFLCTLFFPRNLARIEVGRAPTPYAVYKDLSWRPSAANNKTIF